MGKAPQGVVELGVERGVGWPFPVACCDGNFRGFKSSDFIPVPPGG